jgi:hypothetical protein
MSKNVTKSNGAQSRSFHAQARHTSVPESKRSRNYHQCCSLHLPNYCPVIWFFLSVCNILLLPSTLLLYLEQLLYFEHSNVMRAFVENCSNKLSFSRQLTYTPVELMNLMNMRSK